MREEQVAIERLDEKILQRCETIIMPICIHGEIEVGDQELFISRIINLREALKTKGINLGDLEVVFLVADSLDRYNRDGNKASAIQDGNKWVSSHIPLLSSRLGMSESKDFRVVRWDELLQDEHTSSYIDKYKESVAATPKYPKKS